MVNAGLAYLRILLELYGREFDFEIKLTMSLTIIKGTRQTKQPEIYSHMVVACLLHNRHRQICHGFFCGPEWFKNKHIDRVIVCPGI